MTKKELIKALEPIDDDEVIICMGLDGGWDNIDHVKQYGSSGAIVFGGGSPFTSDN